VDDALVDATLEAALHGSSSSGKLNMVSVIKTRDPARKARVHELHFHQDMVLQAPPRPGSGRQREQPPSAMTRQAPGRAPGRSRRARRRSLRGA
jgi:hypothetical protein